jgi:hypothetical protein
MHPRVRRLPALFVSTISTLTLLAAADQATAVIIDDFSVGPVTVTRDGATAATSTQTGLDPGHVLGGNRNIVVGEFGASSQSLTIDSALRELRFTAPTGGGYFDLEYGSEAQPLNIDLTADGSDAFLVEFAGPGGFVSLNFLRVFHFIGRGRAGRSQSRHDFHVTYGRKNTDGVSFQRLQRYARLYGSSACSPRIPPPVHL